MSMAVGPSHVAQRARVHAPALRRRCASRARAPRASAGAGDAADTVNAGVELFEQGDEAGALKMFAKALTMSPGKQARMGAHYNRACVLVKQRKLAAAAEDLRVAVNDCGLKFEQLVRDDDLAPLRADAQVWTELKQELRGGGGSAEANVRLRAEAQAPFRTLKLFAFGGIGLGAFLGLLIITSKLIGAVAGAPNADDLGETAKNFGINLTAVALLGFLFFRELKEKDKSEARVRREEELGRLAVSLPGGRSATAEELRGLYRPVIVAGSASFIKKQLKEAEPYKRSLQKLGVTTIAVELAAPGGSAKDAPRGFGAALAAAEAEKAAASKVESPTTADGDKWEVKPVDNLAWARWVQNQLEASGEERGKDCYVQIAMNGTVRASGVGEVPWRRFQTELADVNSPQPKLSGE